MELNPEKHQMTGPNYESTPRDFKPKKQLKAILERFSISGCIDFGRGRANRGALAVAV